MKYIRRPIPRQERITHFGISIHKTPYNEITRELYATCDKNVHICLNGSVRAKYQPQYDGKIFEDEKQKKYTDEYCEFYREQCLKNYDINMEYFAGLDAQEFELQLENLQQLSARIVPVENLWEFDNVSGFYVLVLDKYKQVYIDYSPNVRSRIIRHWAKKREFDHLLDGSVEESILNIHSFGALDTTRIFACKASLKHRKRIIAYMRDAIDDKFILNRKG